MAELEYKQEYKVEHPRRYARAVTLLDFSVFTQVIGSLISTGLSIYKAFNNNHYLEESFYGYIQAHEEERTIIAQGLGAHRSSSP